MHDAHDAQGARDPLAALPPPPDPDAPGAPEALASYVRAALRRDRSPGVVVVVAHPFRLDRIPAGLFDALRDRGFDVRVVHTQADHIASLEGIAAALREAHATGRPVDVMVIAGDGTLDHHVLTAAMLAFYPDHAHLTPGVIDASDLTLADGAHAPLLWRRTFLERLPNTEALTPDTPTVHDLWVLRQAADRALRRGDDPERFCLAVGRPVRDPALQLAVWATLAPHKVRLHPPGVDLGAFAEAGSSDVFQGLYGHLRAICVLPAGTASDNALYAGTPGWGFAQASRLLFRWPIFGGLRRWWARRLTARFLDMFTKTGLTVPARFSLVGFDGAWRQLCSHAVGGPGSGALFAHDLTEKGGGLAAYLLRLPGTVLRHGVWGGTVVTYAVTDRQGSKRATHEGQLAEALYTNRAFISGVGVIPSTDPTSFAGRSSVLVAPPIFGPGPDGRRRFALRGLGALLEAIAKGVAGRALHVMGFNPRQLAGGGRLRALRPEQDLTLSEGERLDVHFRTADGHPRAVPTQVSGDPFQAHHMAVKVAWGPLPILASEGSLLLAAVRRGLEHLRMRAEFGLETVWVAGLAWYRHRSGQAWSAEFEAHTGLVAPPRQLGATLAIAQQQLIDAWQRTGLGPFIDTSSPGIQLGRRGRHAHTEKDDAHLVVARSDRSTLMVRMARAPTADGTVFESHCTYSRFGPVFILRTVQVRAYAAGEAPRILHESHTFRDARSVVQGATAFFPLIRDTPTRDLSDPSASTER